MPRQSKTAESALSAQVGARGGRPLDEAVDAAILRAATRLLIQQGYARMSIAGVAEAAGVGRPAIYRRYRDKSELVLAAIAYMRGQTAPPNSGDTRADLVRHLEFARQKFDMTLMGTLLVEERQHPELLQRFREQMIAPRCRDVQDALDRGKARGEVRADLDVELAAQAVMGSFLYRYLSAGSPERGWAEQLVAMLWPAFAAEGSGPRRG
jgi:AcrR family transcriptional regulator